MAETRSGRFARIVALLGAVTLVAFGAWAFFSPESFYEKTATFEPYNRHFIHDIGSFQIGLGAVLLLGAYLRDGLFVALAGVSVGSAVHVVSHVLDRNIGGKPESDIPSLTILTVLLIAGAVARSRDRSTDDGATTAPAPRP